MIEVDQQINAVSRRVGTRVLEAGEARTVTISQTYDASVDDVWDACTNAERIPRWFLPVSGELRLGGRYQLEGNAGGTVQECDPPNSFAATWEYGEEIAAWSLKRTAEGLIAAARGDRDAALLGLLDGPAVWAFELGRLIPNRPRPRVRPRSRVRSRDHPRPEGR